jgi:hypothetical protein
MPAIIYRDIYEWMQQRTILVRFKDALSSERLLLYGLSQGPLSALNCFKCSSLEFRCQNKT